MATKLGKETWPHHGKLHVFCDQKSKVKVTGSNAFKISFWPVTISSQLIHVYIGSGIVK